MSKLVNPRVCILSDSTRRAEGLRDLLEDHCAVDQRLIWEVSSIAQRYVAVVVAVDMREVGAISKLRKSLLQVNDTPCRLFVLERNDRIRILQARALGATDVVLPPITKEKITQRLPIDRPAQAIGACAAALRAVFDRMSRESRVELGDAVSVTEQVIDSVGTNGISFWLDNVRQHHQGTFQHCLLVTGLAVDFGLSLRLSDRDLRNLGLAAALHDIGKAGISLDILDKPGRLSLAERSIVEQHPQLGFDCVQAERELCEDIADVILHHHEYLDGTGYPDRLSGAQILDMTRMITIVDIFAALIEQRSYKPGMARTTAYQHLASMEGKMERALVSAFRSTAFER